MPTQEITPASTSTSGQGDGTRGGATERVSRRKAAAALAATALIAGLLAWQPWDTDPDPGPSEPVTTVTGEPTMEEILAEPHKMFPRDSEFVRDITDAPLNPASEAMMTDFRKNQLAPHYGGIAAFNPYAFTASFWVAEEDTPKVTMKFNDCQGKNHTPPGLFDGPKMFVDVPVPANAQPAKGTDQQLAIYSPSEDKLWEFWIAGKDAGGEWSACWGGRMDDVSQNTRGAFTAPYGAAASGMAFVGSMVSIEEARRLEINHAIGLNVITPSNWDDFSYPANRSDGYTEEKNLIPEGSRLRLDPNVDVDSLGLTPIGAAVARAAQKYGFLITDKAGSIAVVTEGGIKASLTAPNNEDPWHEILGDTPSYRQLEGFPWDRVEVIEKDWGAPDQ